MIWVLTWARTYHHIYHQWKKYSILNYYSISWICMIVGTMMIHQLIMWRFGICTILDSHIWLGHALESRSCFMIFKRWWHLAPQQRRNLHAVSSDRNNVWSCHLTTNQRAIGSRKSCELAFVVTYHCPNLPLDPLACFTSWKEALRRSTFGIEVYDSDFNLLHTSKLPSTGSPGQICIAGGQWYAKGYSTDKKVDCRALRVVAPCHFSRDLQGKPRNDRHLFPPKNVRRWLPGDCPPQQLCCCAGAQQDGESDERRKAARIVGGGKIQQRSAAKCSARCWFFQINQ